MSTTIKQLPPDTRITVIEMADDSDVFTASAGELARAGAGDFFVSLDDNNCIVSAGQFLRLKTALGLP